MHLTFQHWLLQQARAWLREADQELWFYFFEEGNEGGKRTGREGPLRHRVCILTLLLEPSRALTHAHWKTAGTSSKGRARGSCGHRRPSCRAVEKNKLVLATSSGVAKDPSRAELAREWNGSFGRSTQSWGQSSREPGTTQMPWVKKHSGSQLGRLLGSRNTVPETK